MTENFSSEIRNNIKMPTSTTFSLYSTIVLSREIRPEKEIK